MKVLISAPYLVPYIDDYRHFLERHNIEVVVADVEERLEEDQLLAYVGDIDGILAGDDRLTRRVLSSGSRLKVLSKWGTGIDSFDLDAAREFGIAVYNLPGAFNDPVSDSVLGYILTFARRIPWTNAAMHSGRWEKQMGRTVSESTVGIIGVGNTGRAVIDKLSAFGCKILGNDVATVDQAFLHKRNVTMLTLDELLEQSDFVSINCDLNPTSRGLVGAEQLATMKKTAVLINCARGPIVNNGALAAALKNGTIAGAALDVFEEEPLPKESPFRGLENIILAPHNANSSPTAWARVHLIALRNLLRGLDITDDELEAVK